MGHVTDIVCVDAPRSLSNNKLEGGIPEGLWSLTPLQTLDLDTNRFTGTLSASVAKLTKLTAL